MLTPELTVALVDPADLIGGQVNMQWRPGSLHVRIDRTVIDPIVGPEITAMGNRVLRQLAELERHPRMVVRYHLERDMPEGGLVAAEITPYQIDVYVMLGLMPYSLCQEIAGHSTYILRHHL